MYIQISADIESITQTNIESDFKTHYEENRCGQPAYKTFILDMGTK